MAKKISRRYFIYLSGVGSVLMLLVGTLFFWNRRGNRENMRKVRTSAIGTNKNLGVAPDGKSYVYMAQKGSPEENTRKVIEMMGGIEKFIGPTDVVLLKPNAQWWNQGMTNTNSMKAFIEMVLEMSGFRGEVIIGDNHHFPEDNSLGWTTEYRNGDYNYNELVEYFQRLGYSNVTKSHWHDGGPSIPGSWGGAENAGVVKGPEDGDGYIWREDKVFTAPNGRKAMMSYPLFTSQYSGIKVDFYMGLWKEGRFLDRKLKFINFAVLNHHGLTGVTSSIKNYLGICDMTCGYRGTTPAGYYNFHYVGYSSLNWRIKKIMNKFGWRESASEMGGCVGYFMKNVRIADINIVTAEWAGYGSRTDTNHREQTRAVIASIDPVALDYIGARDILMPATLKNAGESSWVVHNNPEIEHSTFRQFLKSCHGIGIGNLENNNINVVNYTFT